MSSHKSCPCFFIIADGSPRLNQALRRIYSFQDRYIILHSVREGCSKAQEPQEHIEMVDDWFQDQMEQALDDIQRVEENDGAILVIVDRKFAKGMDIRRYVLMTSLP